MRINRDTREVDAIFSGECGSSGTRRKGSPGAHLGSGGGLGIMLGRWRWCARTRGARTSRRRFWGIGGAL